jgi:hypothetical protein
MAKVKKSSADRKAHARRRNLFYISLSFLLVKIIIIFSIKFGGWLGSDAEGYVAGAASMLKDGFFAKDRVLSFLPAGYPILIWILALITNTGSFITHATSLMVISIFQSVFYFGACAFFVEKIRSTRLSKFAIPTALFLGFNPTLSLSSLVAGYESVVASCMLLSIALIIDYRQNQERRSLWKTVVFVGLLQSFSGFTQPRELLIGFALLLVWGLFQKSRKILATILITGSCAMLALPLMLVARNIEATGSAVLSSQLGATMSGGAGDGATGGYEGRGFVTCPAKPAGDTVSDNELVVCVLKWYAHHPMKTVQLAINKTIFFWSPWSGPLANGTAARNPWLKVDPIQNIASTAQGRALVLGWFGKVISWIWLLGGLLLLSIGFRWLWQQGGLEREISWLLLIPVILATLISVGTIGDHRYRIPTMGMSLFLQIVGFSALKERILGGEATPALKPKGRAR